VDNRRLESTRMMGAILLAVLMAMLPAGCEATASKAKEVTSTAGDVMRSADFTGATKTNKAITDAMIALRERLDGLDVETLNSAIDQLGELAGTLEERAAALVPEVAGIVSERIDAAQVTELSERLQTLADQWSAQLGRIDVESFNRLVAEAEAKIAVLDIEGLNETVRELNSLRPRVDTVLAEAEGAIGQVGDAAVGLPVAQTEAMVEAVRRSTGGVWFTVWLANILLVLLCVCAIVWLRRATKP